MATYKRLANGRGQYAAMSLFAAGRLAADRGRKTEARTYLQNYLSKYPNGLNAEDARRLLNQLN
jgi:TolA-binding protein